MSQFVKGDRLKEIDSKGNPVSDRIWTFRRYSVCGKVMLMEFPNNENIDFGKYTFNPKFFVKLTPLEVVLE
jgi:hypothetical protein